MTLSHISEVVQPLISTNSSSLRELLAEFKAREANENPGVTVPMSSLRLTAEGTLLVPELGANFAFTPWSLSRLSVSVGVRWNRWFGGLAGSEQASEVNRRLVERTERVLVRTNKLVPHGSPGQGTLLALLSDKFCPIADSQVLTILATALEPVEPDISVVRCAVTDRSTTFVLGLGRPFRPGDDHEVNDIVGGLLIRNSLVGYAALSVLASFTRLLCKNGMTAPIPDALLIRRAHRSFSVTKLCNLLAERLRQLPGKFATAANVLVAARAREVKDAREEVATILRKARLPLALLPAIERDYDAEPRLRHSAFRVSMALTRFAQTVNPEVRFELERAAGEYLAHLSSAAN